MYYLYKSILLFGLLAAVAHAIYVGHEESEGGAIGGGFKGGFEGGQGGGFEGGQGGGFEGGQGGGLEGGHGSGLEGGLEVGHGGGFEGGQGGGLEEGHGGGFEGGQGGGLEGGYGGGIEAGSLGGGEHHEEHHDYYSPPHYKYEYSVHDPRTGDIKSHHESRVGDHVKGYYTLHESDGTIREVHYTADKHNGFNAEVKRIGKAHHAPVYGYHEHHV